MNIAVRFRGKVKVDDIGNKLEIDSTGDPTFFIFHSLAVVFIFVHLVFTFHFLPLIQDLFISRHDHIVDTFVELFHLEGKQQSDGVLEDM